jgi:predicted DNA-binding transcriptional regulator AlpA
LVAFPRKVRLQQIAQALIACGYTKLDNQAKALGVSRSTAWTIINTKHKLGRLSTKTTKRILANPETPPPVRVVIQEYLAERSDALTRRAKRLETIRTSSASN